ncbi:MAG: hypothetical protein K8T25_12995 [Planctomycetia bacterium]|nr:hypothetical protein [Planctomycetia bacterium]
MTISRRLLLSFTGGSLTLLLASLVPAARAADPVDTPVAGWQDKADAPATVNLKVDDVTNAKGDGADGKGNTDDDTWGFWFQLADSPSAYHRLDLNTTTMTTDQRQHGIRDPHSRKGHQGKVAGPIAGSLPNSADTEGWIFHSDWDGRFEGVWGDKKANVVMMHPFVEKHFHGGVAISYRVPATGEYTITGKLKDLQPLPPGPKSDGVTWLVDVAEGGKQPTVLKKGEPFGDGAEGGRSNSAEFKIENVKLGGGRHVRLVILPNAWWGADLTAIESFKIEKVK